MIYVVGQIWVWLLVALALGALLCWLWLRLTASNRTDEQVAPWRDRVNALERERDGLRRELGEARDRATESEARLSALRDDLDEREERIDGLVREIDTLKSTANGRPHESGDGPAPAVIGLTAAAPRSREPRDAEPDQLTRIKGIGKTLEVRLNALGITTYAQIATLSASDIARIDAALGFKGRVEREDWIGQAQALADGH